MLLSSLLIISSACQNKKMLEPKEDENNISFERSLLSYIGYFEQMGELDGELRVTLDNASAGQHLPNSKAIFEGGIFDRTTNKYIKYAESIDVADENITPDPNTFGYRLSGSTKLANSFGTDAIFKLNKINNTENSASHTVYFPKKLIVELEENPNEIHTHLVRNGSVLKWNKDEKNTKGVVIFLEYDPFLNGGNPRADKFPDLIKKVIFTEDTGSYTFKTDDLAGFPKDLITNITIGRAGMDLYSLPDTEKVIGILGITTVLCPTYIK